MRVSFFSLGKNERRRRMFEKFYDALMAEIIKKSHVKPFPYLLSLKSMKNLKRMSANFLGPIFLLLFLFSITSPCAFSETLPMEDSAYQEVVRLRSLKVSDPEKYRVEIEAKREKIKSQIQDWKSNQPEKYQSFLKQDQNLRRNKIEQFRKRHPEEFRQFAKNRMKRFENLREKNPEKFKQVMAAHPGFERRFERLSGDSPPRSGEQRFENNPQVKMGQNPEKTRTPERSRIREPINRRDFEKRRLENQKGIQRSREKRMGVGNLAGVNGGTQMAPEGRPLIKDRKPGNPEGQVRGNPGGSANKPLARKGRRERA